MMKILVAAAMILAAFGTQAAMARETGHGGLGEACGADVKQYCSGIPAGGSSRMQCLTDHRENLSEGCKAAMNTAKTAREACALDAQKYCTSTAPGADRLKCMQDNRDKLSDGCKSALSGMAVGAD